MTEIQGKSILARVSARFELARVRVIGSRLYQKKKIGHLSSCDWEILNTLTEDELSSALIYQLGIIQKD